MTREAARAEVQALTEAGNSARGTEKCLTNDSSSEVERLKEWKTADADGAVF